MTSRVLLLQMPFGSLRFPSLSLSLLKASLLQAGYGCEIRYLNHDFAALIGAPAYETISDLVPQMHLLGELVFAPTLFSSRYDLQQLRRPQPEVPPIPDWLVARLPWISAMAEQFLRRALAEIPWSLYRLVGFGSMFQQVVPALALARRLKAAGGPPVILGGPNCEGEMGLALHRCFPWLDFVCQDEGERLIVDLMRHLTGGGVALESIGGLISRAGERSVVHPANDPVSDLDELPVPEYRDWLAQLRRSDPTIAADSLKLPIETSRGCWYGAKAHCVFCGLNGQTMAFRSKSPQRVVDELTGLAEHGIRSVFAVDNILDFRYFKTLLPELSRLPQPMEIFYEVKSNLGRSQIELLAAAGIKAIQPGIESLSTSVLDLMHKGVTALQNVRLLKWCAEHGIEVVWNFLYGVPGEEPAAYERMAELVSILTHLPPPAGGCAPLRLDRFSPMFVRPQDFGIDNIRPASAYRRVFPLPEADLRQLAYYFDYDHPNRLTRERYLEPLQLAVESWRASHSSAAFTAIDHGEALELADSRPRAKARRAIARGIERQVLLACDAGASLRRLRTRLPQAADAVERVVGELVARRWLVELDGSYLSLAVAVDRGREQRSGFGEQLEDRQGHGLHAGGDGGLRLDLEEGRMV